MKRVTGLGGIFFKADDPKKLQTWYEEHLGLPKLEDGSIAFTWRDADRPEKTGMTVWSAFKKSSTYFEPTTAPFMINYRVDDLDALLAVLRAEGVWIDEKREDAVYGRFAWIRDPEGNRIELWEPPKT